MRRVLIASRTTRLLSRQLALKFLVLQTGESRPERFSILFRNACARALLRSFRSLDSRDRQQSTASATQLLAKRRRPNQGDRRAKQLRQRCRPIALLPQGPRLRRCWSQSNQPSDNQAHPLSNRLHLLSASPVAQYRIEVEPSACQLLLPPW